MCSVCCPRRVARSFCKEATRSLRAAFASLRAALPSLRAVFNSTREALSRAKRATSSLRSPSPEDILQTRRSNGYVRLSSKSAWSTSKTALRWQHHGGRHVHAIPSRCAASTWNVTLASRNNGKADRLFSFHFAKHSSDWRYPDSIIRTGTSWLFANITKTVSRSYGCRSSSSEPSESKPLSSSESTRYHLHPRLLSLSSHRMRISGHKGLGQVLLIPDALTPPRIYFALCPTCFLWGWHNGIRTI